MMPSVDNGKFLITPILLSYFFMISVFLQMLLVINDIFTIFVVFVF